MLVIVPASGVSGDMLLSALIDLGAGEGKIANFLKKELGISVRTERVIKHDVGARRLIVQDSEKHYSPEEMKRIMGKSSLGKDAKSSALAALESLIQAEQKIHGTKNVHFHELAHIDTLVDIMGCAYAIELLGEGEIYVLPVEVGKIAPATLEIFTNKKIPFYSADTSFEFTTPTGATLVANLAKPVSGIPLLISESVGYGAGNFERKGEPNVLRVIRGSEPDRKENIIILETNLDDVSGEIIAYAVERLFEEGAKDVCLIPVIAKKGRPGVILRAICDRDSSERLTRIIFEETGTLGIRESECSRHIASRSTIKDGDIRIKIGKIGGRIISSKPEFEDLKKIAKKKGRPLREVTREI